MNIKNLISLSFICIAHCNVYAMKKTQFYGKKEFVNIMVASQFTEIAQTPKFKQIIQEPEFFVIMQAPEFQTFVNAIHSQSPVGIQEALEELLETKAMKLLFETETFSDAIRIKFNAMRKTEAYDEYQTAKEYHRTEKTAESQNMLNEYRETWRNTKEYKELRDAANAEMFTNNSTPKEVKPNNSPIYSDNVAKKNDAMMKTTEWQQFQQAKADYEQNPSEDTKYIFTLYQEDLYATKECQEFVKAANQETPIKHNNINSENWKNEQPYSSSKPIESIQNKINNAWKAATNTKEYKKLHDAANAEMFTNNNTQTFSATTLEKYQAIKSTSEYTEYQKAKQLHEQNNSDDTQDIIYCYLEVFTEEKAYDLLKNINQETEKSVLNNIIQSEKWVAEQKYRLFPILKSTHDRTSLLQVKVIDFLFNKLEAQLSLTKSQKNNSYNAKTQSQIGTNNYGRDLKTIAQPQSHTNALSFQEQELKTYQNQKWLREQIDKIKYDRNKALIAYKNTNEYRRLEQAKKQKPCPNTFVSIADAQERAYKTQQSRNFRKLNAQLNYLDKELNKLIKNEALMHKPHNQALRLPNNNHHNNNA